MNNRIFILKNAMENDPLSLRWVSDLKEVGPELLKLWIAAEAFVGEEASVKDLDSKYEDLVEALVNLNTRSYQVIP